MSDGRKWDERNWWGYITLLTRGFYARPIGSDSRTGKVES